MVSGELAIAAHHLTKHYGGLKEGPGLNGLTLGVPKGTIYGLLGPNGAGKTTAVKVFTTLLQPDSGSAAVAGFDVKPRVTGYVKRSAWLVSMPPSMNFLREGGI